MSHTPGPWERCSQYIRTQRGGEYDGFLIAEVCMSLPEYRANAHLLSAAPDLLDALQELVDHQNGCPLPKYEEGWNEAMRKAQAAIAKATPSD